MKQFKSKATKFIVLYGYRKISSMKSTLFIVNLLFGCFCSIVSADLSDGLVLHCPFNGNANDSSGYAQHGIVVDATLTEDQHGQNNSAYELDGVNDYIYLGPVLPDMKELTVVTWLFAYTPSPGSTIFLSDGDFKIRIASSTQVIIEAQGVGASLRHSIDFREQITDRWIHLVWIMTESYSSVYIDGVKCAEVQEQGSNTVEHNLCIGATHSRYYGPRNPYWKGKISSLRVYNRPLSETEITDLYNFHESAECYGNCLDDVTIANFKQDLIAFYPFNGNAKDISGHDHHGTVIGAIPTKDQHGIENSAFELDGIDDYIYFGPVLPDMTEMTVSFWIYAPPPTGNREMIFSDGQAVFFWIVRDDRTIKITAKKNGAPLSRALDTHTSITNRWVHFVWVLTPEHSSVYVDGVGSLRVYEWGSNVGNHDLNIGVESGSSSGTYWRGKISSLRIYQRALLSSEIAGLYQLESSPDYHEGNEFKIITSDLKELLYVDDDVEIDPGPGDITLSDPNEDGTAEHPYDSIQEAIEAAKDGYKIVVRSGTYYETIDFLGKSIHLTGFDPNVESQKEKPCPIIDANYQGTVVTFASGEDPNTQLSGFTITRGFGRYAGGIFCSGSSSKISNCLIVGNRAESLCGGGAVYCSNSNAIFENCTISGNYGGQAGAGFYSEDSQNTITNSILWDNLPAEIGFPMFGAISTPPMLTYCDLTLEAYGAGNLAVDPLFVSPGYWAETDNPDVPTDATNSDAIWIAGNYHLMKESPCIDAGDPNRVVDVNQFDLDGQPRLVNHRIDMGADEYISVELNFTALYDDIFISLTQDTSSVSPEATFIGTTTIQLDASFRLMLLGQAFAISDAGGRWDVTISPDIIGPGMDIDVEVTIKGTEVDISKLTATSGDIVLADIEIGGILAP